MAIIAKKNVFRFQIPINYPHSMEILERHEHLRGEEPDGLYGQSATRLFPEKRVKIAAGTVIDEKTNIVRDVDVSVKRRKKRVVQHRKNVGFHFDMGELLIG